MTAKILSHQSTVRDAMTAHVTSVSPLDTLARVQTIFKNKRFHHLPVLDQDTIVGIISTSDLERSKHGTSFFRNEKTDRYNEALLQTILVETVMTKEFRTISPNASTNEAYQEFKRGSIRCLLVTENDVLLGIITPLDLCEAFII
ncbi:MAG: CBS domain-containing protein [Saprospiraceae bacterium]|nr:CBS domain-containing protein [Saprospiraceae bacterium]